ncbi:MAG: hypothetical protein BWY31_02945 [Lentisphaerae bacterium ADurb.Bin242]|nr:MAG: hypothetical protein BWY31_02945 [Lentisphaerae bacterium ADurb.Bin242]
MIRKEGKIRAGFVGFGEVNTPREFIDTRCASVVKELKKRGVELTVTAPVSDDPEGKQARRAVEELSKADFDALVVCIAGWIPTWAVIQTIEPFKHKPILLWGLSGWRERGRFVTTADQAGTTALRAPMKEMGFRFQYLVNKKDSAPRYDEAVSFLNAASADARMRHALIGMSGYRDMRLYGTLYDGTLLKKTVGAEIEHFDLLEIQQIMETIPEKEIAALAKKIRKDWVFVRTPKEGTVENSVRLMLAFRRKIEERGYDAFSFCDVDGVKKLLKFAPAGALTLLHDVTDIPSVPENDSYGAVTELILKNLTGKSPAYLEFYEFTKDSALMGVPDYVPASIADGRITVMPNAFGSFGEGLLNVSRLKTGIVTIARLGQMDGRLILHAVKGEAKTPEAWEEAGWAPPAPQLPSLEVFFGKDSDEFLKNVLGQHYILAYGDHLDSLRNYCAVAGIEFIS